MKLVYILVYSFLVTWTVLKIKKVYGTYSLISTEVSNPYTTLQNTDKRQKSSTIIFCPYAHVNKFTFLRTELTNCFYKHNSKLKEWKLKYNPAAEHFSLYYIMNSILISSLKGLAVVNLVTNRIRPLDIQQQTIQYFHIKKVGSSDLTWTVQYAPMFGEWAGGRGGGKFRAIEEQNKAIESCRIIALPGKLCTKYKSGKKFYWQDQRGDLVRASSRT